MGRCEVVFVVDVSRGEICSVCLRRRVEVEASDAACAEMSPLCPHCDKYPCGCAQPARSLREVAFELLCSAPAPLGGGDLEAFAREAIAHANGVADTEPPPAMAVQS
jgi:hypothetical protein